jgi:peptide chain release factor 1
MEHMNDNLTSKLSEYAEIEQKLSDPSVASDPKKVKVLSKKYAMLKPVVSVYNELSATKGDLETANELAREDKAFLNDAKDLQEKVTFLEEKLTHALTPKDSDDIEDVIMEIKAGAGGEESALFAGDLLRMYQLYAQKRHWAFKILSMSDTGIGGVKDVQISIESKESNKNASDEGVWANLKYEGGVHRVQRIPVTESQGRIHTSATGVYVYPNIEPDESVKIEPQDIRVDVFRSSGPGGQSVNTTDSAVRITHIPTGIVVSMQNEKSQIQNREVAMKVLASRLSALRKEKEMQKASDLRHSQVRTVDRSERIRTYNFPENRIVDHRIGYKAYNLDQVMNGELDAIVDACKRANDSAIRK